MIAIDVFCGGGGMTCGLLKAGIQVIAGIDSNLNCKETYEKNNAIPCYNKNVLEITGEELKKKFPQIRDNNNLLMVGCAPCQPFSILNPNDPSKHISVNLLNEFGRLVEEIKPAHILVENVASIGKRGQFVLDNFKNLLRKEGYLLCDGIVNAKDYGVPQNRRRYILLASKKFIPRIPKTTHGNDKIPYVTVSETIRKYPPLKAGDDDETYFNHKCAKLSDTNMKRIKSTPHDGGGRKDWPPNLWLNCHQDFSGHSDVYGRMKWDSVSPTLTSKCFSLSNGRFGHPEQDRAISLREAAALQTFPDEYHFYGSLAEIGKQVGNAVPVLLAQKLGEYILEH